MTPDQLQARLTKLIAYTQRLAADHNKLEQKVKVLQERVTLLDGIGFVTITAEE
jgi:hypothetical protein